jgi:cytochrome P450
MSQGTQATTSLPPGPKGLPYLGQALRYQKDPFGFFVWMREHYGDISRDASSGFPLMQIYSPEAIEHVLVRNAKNYHKDRILKSWDLVFGEGLLVTEGDHWKRDRRVIQPAFSRARLAEYEGLMQRHAERVGGSVKWRSGQSLNVLEEMTELTLRIALDSLFGEEANAEVAKQDMRDVSKALKALADWFEFSSGAFMALTLLLPRFPFPRKIRYERAVTRLDAILSRIIERKRREFQKSGAASNDLLGALISASDPEAGQTPAFTDRQVRDHALTFFLAGHETTSLALTYILRLLALHPEVQSQLRGALRGCVSREEVPGIPSKTQRLAQLEKCDLLDQVIDEAMRLYPPAAVTAREAVGDDLISGYRIPAGTTVVIPTWAIHRDPRFFGHDVETFRPGRWTPEFRKALPRAVYLPFGFGPRMCIGFSFAIQEMKLILAELLLKHEFSVAPGGRPLRLQSSVTMRPRDPVLLQVRTL